MYTCAIHEAAPPSMEVDLYAEVAERLRRENKDLVLNLTTGPGGRYQPSSHDPLVPGPRTNLLVPEKRVQHVVTIRPDIATLDLNTMTFGREVVITTPESVRRMAALIRGAGVRPELELFDSGDIALLTDLIRDNTLQAPPLCSIVMGVKYGFQPSPETLLYARDPASRRCHVDRPSAREKLRSQWSRNLIWRVATCESGLKTRFILAAECWPAVTLKMVKKACRIIEDLGGQVATCQEVRERLSLSAVSVS